MLGSQIRASPLSSSISAILASSGQFISASSSFSFIEHLLVANGHARMIQKSDVCYTTSMYVTQSWCIPDEIDLCYFRICIITHNNNLFNKTSMYSHSKFCPQKTPIPMDLRLYHPMHYTEHFLLSFAYQREMTNFRAFWGTWTTTGNFLYFYIWNWMHWCQIEGGKLSYRRYAEQI